MTTPLITSFKLLPSTSPYSIPSRSSSSFSSSPESAFQRPNIVHRVAVKALSAPFPEHRNPRILHTKVAIHLNPLSPKPFFIEPPPGYEVDWLITALQSTLNSDSLRHDFHRSLQDACRREIRKEAAPYGGLFAVENSLSYKAYAAFKNLQKEKINGVEISSVSILPILTYLESVRKDAELSYEHRTGAISPKTTHEIETISSIKKALFLGYNSTSTGHQVPLIGNVSDEIPLPSSDEENICEILMQEEAYLKYIGNTCKDLEPHDLPFTKFKKWVSDNIFHQYKVVSQESKETLIQVFIKKAMGIPAVRLAVDLESAQKSSLGKLYFETRKSLHSSSPEWEEAFCTFSEELQRKTFQNHLPKDLILTPHELTTLHYWFYTCALHYDAIVIDHHIELVSSNQEEHNWILLSLALSTLFPSGISKKESMDFKIYFKTHSTEIHLTIDDQTVLNELSIFLLSKEGINFLYNRIPSNESSVAEWLEKQISKDTGILKRRDELMGALLSKLESRG